jgi:hypothetical protein
MKRLGRSALELLIFAGAGCAQVTTPDPVRAILSAFDRVNLVGLGERHGSVEDLQFRLKLIRDPRFARVVDDIVVEFANPLHQAILDKFVNGEEVSRDELSKVWKTTTQPAANSPVYEEFISGVREINKSLPAGKLLRVVAGDYPFDGNPPASGRGFDPGFRDTAPADVIRREVLSKNHKGLVVFGGFHFFRKQPEFSARMAPNGNFVMLLQNDPRVKWFVVFPLGGPDLPWPVTAHRGTPEKPAWVADRTALDMDAAALGWADHPDQFKVRQLVDALLYFGGAAPVIAPVPRI